MTLPADPRSPAASRAFVRECLALHQLDGLVEDVALVVSELTTNVIVHVGTPFTVSLRADGDGVVLAVQDGSPSPISRVDPAAADVSGRGVAIVDALSRSWGVVIGAGAGKSVWAAFDA